ncbi:MAG: hypothetical protein JWR69_1736 [Pedosphaera sp.]|nr:hypothetical protein [Pedosphaera sp.]
MDVWVILVRQKESLEFLSQEGLWVGSVVDARRFGTTWEARLACRTACLSGVEIIMRFRSPRYDIVIEVD